MSKLAEKIYNETMERFYRLKDVTGSTREYDVLYCLSRTLEDSWPYELEPDEYSEVEKRVLFMASV